MNTLYDLEDMLDDIEALLKANLNTKIEAITAAKSAAGKSVTLPTVRDEAYFRQNWTDNILNYSPAIFYGVETIQASGSNSATVEVYKFFVEALFVDNGMDTDGERRLFRYSRAIKEVFQEKFDALPWGTKINIETVRPISFKLDQDSSEEVKAGGVSIITALA